MTSILLLFLDGVGLGAPDPHSNPFAQAKLPSLKYLLNGRELSADLEPFSSERCTFVRTDATLGVSGRPQSATGQATLLTGVNVAQAIGEHYGPKPNQAIRDVVHHHNLLTELRNAGRRAALVNAYPPRYFAGIRSGLRLLSVIPFAFFDAGLPIPEEVDLRERRALSADFTGVGWHQRLGYSDTPVLTPREAGSTLAQLACRQDFSVFDGWLTDYAGHSGDMQASVAVLNVVDTVVGELHAAGEKEGLLTVVTSDHGNLEDLRERGHTGNPVPTLVLGPRRLREAFAGHMTDLTGLAPAVREILL
jgi:hypothetical protein